MDSFSFSPLNVKKQTIPRRCFFCGLFLLVMLHVGVCRNVLSFLFNIVVTCWERADLFAVVCVVFCRFPKFVLVNIRIKGEVGALKLVKDLQLNILLTVPRRYFFCGSFMFLFCLVSSPEPKAHGWANSIPVTLLSVRPSTFSNIFSSETTGPIKLKFHMMTP